MSDYTELRNWYEPAGASRFSTTQPVRWELGTVGSGAWIVVPVGFIFDVSIPRPMRWLFDPFDERFLKAACLHDYALTTRWSRTSAAGPFADALAADNVPCVTRFIMVISVIAWRWS